MALNQYYFSYLTRNLSAIQTRASLTVVPEPHADRDVPPLVGAGSSTAPTRAVVTDRTSTLVTRARFTAVFKTVSDVVRYSSKPSTLDCRHWYWLCPLGVFSSFLLVPNFNQSEARKDCFLASDWLKFGKIPYSIWLHLQLKTAKSF